VVEVDLWIWSLGGDPGPLAAHLSPEEEARAARFVRPGDGDAYRIGRGRLRAILGGLTGTAPGALVFDTNPQGKPSLAGGPSFNLSHSGGLAVLAVGPAGTALGIDIEAPRAVEEGVARRFFSPAEQAALAGWPGDWLDGFFRIWTRKEAVVKGCGPGLSMPLDCFDVTLDDAPRLTRLDYPGQRVADWQMRHLGLGTAHLGALAVACGARPLSVRLREGPAGLPVHVSG
jgi:4'-phosphopantetheinyl transferase